MIKILIKNNITSVKRSINQFKYTFSRLYLEMTEIKNLMDSLFREALWRSYKKQCFYCNKQLSLKTLQIDHVIPQSLGKENAIKEYMLEDDFELDSYYNLVPTCYVCNNSKRDKAYPKNQMFILLNKIKDMVPKIEKLENKLKSSDLKNDISLAVKKGLDQLPLYEIIQILNDSKKTTWQDNVLQETLKQLTPISTLNPKENQQLQLFIDEINKILRDFIPLNDFFKVKVSRFIDNKAGIVIVKEGFTSVTYSFYTVPKVEKNIINEISVEQWYNLAHRGLFETRTTDVKKTILKFPKREAKCRIFEYFADLISVNALYRSSNEIIAKEFIFDFIDNYCDPLGLEIKDEYNLEKIIFSLRNYFPLWIEESLRKLDNTKIQNMISKSGYIDIGTLEISTSSFIQDIKNAILERINTNWELSKDTLKLPFGTTKFPLTIFEKFLSNLKIRSREKIYRLYDKPNYSREEFKISNIIFDLYSDDSVKEKLQFIYDNLQLVYDDIVQRIFPNLKNRLIPFADCNKMIVEIRKKKNWRALDTTPFSLYKYYLKGETREKFKLIFSSDMCDLIHNEVKHGKTEKISFKGTEYKVYGGGGILDYIYRPLPIFNEVKEILTQKFLQLFEIDYKSIISKIIY